jgi:hypothetical protein
MLVRSPQPGHFPAIPESQIMVITVITWCVRWGRPRIWLPPWFNNLVDLCTGHDLSFRLSVCRGIQPIVTPSISSHMNYLFCHLSVAIWNIWYRTHTMWRKKRLSNVCELRILMALKIWTMVFKAVTPCSLVGDCQRFGGTYRLRLQNISEDGGDLFLR